MIRRLHRLHRLRRFLSDSGCYRGATDGPADGPLSIDRGRDLIPDRNLCNLRNLWITGLYLRSSAVSFRFSMLGGVV